MKRRELYHHGIPGQKWGKRNGPPYPLSKHSATEKKAALDKRKQKRYNKSKTIERGKYFVGSILGKMGNKPISELNDISNGKIKILSKPESVDEVLKAVNPSQSTTNCSGCVVASPLRLCGYDVTAVSDVPRSDRQIYEVAKAFKIDPNDQREIFDVAKPTIDRLSRNIEKQYKDGDSGAIAFMWNDKYKDRWKSDLNSGHTLNWIVQDGKVRFFDAQCGKDDAYMRQMLGFTMDDSEYATIVKFANIENGIDLTKDVDAGALKHYIK